MTVTTDPKAQQGTLSSYSTTRSANNSLSPSPSLPARLSAASHMHSASLNALAVTSSPRPLGSTAASSDTNTDSDSDVLSKLSFSSQDFQRRYLGKADKLLDGHAGMAAHSEDNLIDSLLSNYLDSRFLDYVEKMDKEERTNTVKQLLILFAKVGRLLTVSTYSVELEMKSAMRKLLEETIDIMHAEIAYVYFMDHTRKELILESAALSPNVTPVALGSMCGAGTAVAASARSSTKDLLAVSVSSSGSGVASGAAGVAASGRQLPFKYQLGQRFAFGRGIASLCIERDCMINIRNSEADAAAVDSEVDGLGVQPVVGLLAIPLRHSDGRPLGCLVALNKLGGAGTGGAASTSSERGLAVAAAVNNANNNGTQPSTPSTPPTRLNLPFGMRRHPFSHEDDFLFRILRIQTEMIVSNAASYDDMKKTQKKVEVLLDTTRHLSSQLELSALIQEIMRGARELLGADRCTLFLLDEEKKELWSQIPDKEGQMKNIRFPATMGIAGAVAMTGQPINIPDAYADPRFNKDVDKTTGYRTSSILCMPIKNADGAIVGVTQMINKLNGVFTADDEQLLDAFSAQAAVAIEKSVLFQQTERMRDYLDSILASLSPCVVSLSQQLRMNTINRPWLMDFLGTTRETMEAQSIDSWLGEDNQMMLQDIRSVWQSGVSAYSSDYELRGANKQTKIINYNIVRHIGGQGVVVIIEDISNERRALSTLSRYMSPELAKLVMQEGSAQLGGVRKQVSVLFSDVRGFTEISESLKPNQVVELLNEHFTHCVNAIIDNSGILDKYIGDAIMAVFGVPFVSADDAVHACNTALRMIADLNEWNLARQKAGLKTISIGIGINTGEVLSGNIGSEKRMEFSCIGDAVNLSSRVEGLTKYYGVTIMITAFTRAETRDLFVTRELDTVCPVGKRNPIVMYELVARVGDTIPEAKQLQIVEYEAALGAYYKADFEAALEGFERVLTHGKDKASSLMIERCKKYLEDDSLRATFTGIYIADSK
ncbi:hypothetical protein BCR44DRAFT_1435973 [Catenaria anguillulae PL171]|uniref:Guanylate cyclase domain-containing protein n=1 Tax=Catenaria anguillulae PL171 TaxID=765915 RepID=A0A1Y2HKR9_9FUNG|nr:hypothetical protein BCR44DRAFT_1435973 [Catenaria anguillulae PL171]